MLQQLYKNKPFKLESVAPLLCETGAGNLAVSEDREVLLYNSMVKHHKGPATSAHPATAMPLALGTPWLDPQSN